MQKCLLAMLIVLSDADAASAVRKTVEFSIVRDVGIGNEVCVLGSHPQLGGGNPVRALKLAWNPGNVWRGSIALEAGENLSYRYISRPYGVSTWGNATLRTDLTVPPSTTRPVLDFHTPSRAARIWAAPGTANQQLTQRASCGSPSPRLQPPMQESFGASE